MKIRSVLLGSAGTVLMVVAMSTLLSLFSTFSAPVVGDPDWKQTHNQLVGLTSVKALTIGAWCISALVGGMIAGFVAESRLVLHSFAAGSLVAVLWGLPSVLIGGTNLSPVHLLSIAAIIPFSSLGGYVVSRVRT
ncbi:hypothetical protein GCM10011521_21340 [Arenimonas soli]|uniref:Uncharacterized protein n=1 Tax=Arenimonas soli TaxID=2269504 RepID=A0ABQ1HN69_9GAMM|nr:hypothetical protein GCM10011521_21340 [Arenimonas soli]